MSLECTESKKQQKRSIPRLQNRQLGAKSDANAPNSHHERKSVAMPMEGKSLKQEKDGQGHGVTAVDGEDANVHRARRRSGKTATRSTLQIQGPFNPSIVANLRKNQDTEPKRKRNEVSTGKFLANIAVPEPEDPSPKRNSTKDKTKCKVEFTVDKDRVDTEFSGKSVTSPDENNKVHFTARSTRQSTLRGYRDLQKSVKQLQAKLSEQMASENEKDGEIKKLQQQLSSTQKKILQMEEANENLKKDFRQRKEILEDDVRTTGDHNVSLEKRLALCAEKLQQCSINPVTLEMMNPSDNEKEVLKQTRKNAVEKANLLKAQINENNKKNDCIIAEMKELQKELEGESNDQSPSPV